jgi:hypothetical protein
MNEYEQAKAELQALLKEKTELDIAIPELQLRLKTAEARRLEFANTWQGKGLIYFAKLKLAESRLPVFKPGYRIVGITDKWVTIKEDGEAIGNEYSVTTGRKKGARNDGDKIDVEKALKIWANRVIYE